MFSLFSRLRVTLGRLSGCAWIPNFSGLCSDLPTAPVDLLCRVRLYRPFAFPFGAKKVGRHQPSQVTSLLSIWTHVANCGQNHLTVNCST